MNGNDALLAAFTIAVVFWFALWVFPAILNVVFWLLNKLFGER